MVPGERVSIAIPLYNEEAVLAELLQRTLAVVDKLPGGPHEVVLVDDGSRDQTLSLMKEAASADSRIVVVALSRNFGHQAAFSAGLQHTSGDVVVLMDGDLQDPPEVIPKLLDAYRDGYDVVYAVRMNRKEGLLLRFCYHCFYRVITVLAGIRLPRNAGDFCLMSRRVVDQLNRSPEQHRYLRGMRAWVGFKQIGIPIERQQRTSGKSKYSWRRLFQLAFDGIFSFSVVPLRVATLLGVGAIACSIAVAGYALYGKFMWPDTPQGFTGVMITMTFFSGVQLVFLGVIGEYVGRIYEEVKGRPNFIVDQIIRHATTVDDSTSAVADASESGGNETDPI